MPILSICKVSPMFTTNTPNIKEARILSSFLCQICKIISIALYLIPHLKIIFQMVVVFVYPLFKWDLCKNAVKIG